MSLLVKKKCLPIACQKALLDDLKIKELLKELESGWSITTGNELKKVFKFKNFDTALKFLEEIAQLAKLENHHPALLLDFDHVTLTITTHSVKGLTENDFILAAKAEIIFLTFHQKS
jgi:4a-hydroxytetrahydrobiopterin dehydratase